MIGLRAAEWPMPTLLIHCSRTQTEMLVGSALVDSILVNSTWVGYTLVNSILVNSIFVGYTLVNSILFLSVILWSILF